MVWTEVLAAVVGAGVGVIGTLGAQLWRERRAERHRGYWTAKVDGFRLDPGRFILEIRNDGPRDVEIERITILARGSRRKFYGPLPAEWCNFFDSVSARTDFGVLGSKGGRISAGGLGRYELHHELIPARIADATRIGFSILMKDGTWRECWSRTKGYRDFP